jgi:glycosyltransferase involved in cell wall biosynthesis/SAM-dependent methyltransferase
MGLLKQSLVEIHAQMEMLDRGRTGACQWTSCQQPRKLNTHWTAIGGISRRSDIRLKAPHPGLWPAVINIGKIRTVERNEPDTVTGSSPGALYGPDYYASHLAPFPYDRSHPHWLSFFGKIADELIRSFQPRRVFDAGCAHGFLVECLWDRGVEAWGRDVSEFAISQVRPDLRRFCSVESLSEPISGEYDLVTCIEVLEHMSEEKASLAVARMAVVTNRIVFSSSPTDLTEPTHVNVKPPIYWMRQFSAQGFAPVGGLNLPSLAPYTLVLERSEAGRRDQDLLACADLVRVRMHLAERDHTIAHLRSHVGERDRALQELSAEVSDRNLTITSLRGQADEQSRALENLRGELEERVHALSGLESIGDERDEKIQTIQAELDAANLSLTNVGDELLRLRSEAQRRSKWSIRSLRRRFVPTPVRRRIAQTFWSFATLQNGASSRDRIQSGQDSTVATPANSAPRGVEAPSLASVEFDREWYLREYKDVAAGKLDPFQHYMTYGMAEERFPNARAAAAAVLQLSELCDPDRHEQPIASPDDAFRISVLTPTYNIAPRYLRELFQTLLNQQYPNWEWVVVDDGSSNSGTVAVLRELAAADRRVRLFLNQANQGISAASNVALAEARGTHVALVDHDDLVARDAFLKVYEDWKVRPNTQWFYTDECKLFADGSVGAFWPKPDWSPTYLENTMCIGHLSIYEVGFVRGLGGFRSEFDGTQDYDLALRASLKATEVRHLPIFAYLWRAIPGSSALSLDQKHYAVERQGRAVLEYARHKCPDATVVPGWHPGYWRIKYPLASPAPLLSYVIPTGGGSRLVRGEQIDLIANCIRSLEGKRFYANCEYIVIHNGNLTKRQIRSLEAISGVVLVHYQAPAFNLSEKLNLGVRHARGEFLCLLNDDVEVITEGGGAELISYLAQNPSVGAIGPLCLREDGTIQQNGVVLLGAVGPVHAGDRRPRNFGGHHSMLRCRRESFAIGGAMVFVRKAVYEAAGGYGEDLPLNYNDVDFGLRLRDFGYSSVVDPGVVVFHYEGATKAGTSTVEQERLFVKHPDLSDPYFSKWFDPGDPNFRLALRPEKPPIILFGPWLDRRIGRRSAELASEGRFRLSVCVSVYNQPKRFLEEMYKSVLMQTYANKEFLILDNGSTNPETLEWLRDAAGEGSAKFIRVDKNIGISGAQLNLLSNVTGDFVVSIDADDFISVDALQILANAIERNPSRKLFYSDEYKSDVNSDRFSPFFKPDFDPILLMNCCYPAHLMTINTEFLKEIRSYRDDRATWCHDYDSLTRALAVGEEPVHIRELIYAWRINPGSTASAATGTKPGTVESQRFVLTRLLRDRGLENMLSVEPNTLETSSGMWRLTARKPVAKVKVFDASEVWGHRGLGVSRLVAAAKLDVDWVAILLSPRDPQALLELSAVGLLDARVAAVSGLLTDDDGGVIHWSGGLFLPGGRLIDPYAGRRFSEGGYHGQLWCQRCVDVAAPVNLLVRSKALVKAAARLSGNAGSDALMTILGLEAHENGEFIAVTPHLREAQSKDPPLALPLDRGGLLLGAASLQKGSRWYDGRLSTDDPYAISDRFAE